MPRRKSIASDSGKERDTPNTIVAAPETRDGRRSARPARSSGDRWTKDMIRAPHAGSGLHPAQAVWPDVENVRGKHGQQRRGSAKQDRKQVECHHPRRIWFRQTKAITCRQVADARLLDDARALGRCGFVSTRYGLRAARRCEGCHAINGKPRPDFAAQSSPPPDRSSHRGDLKHAHIPRHLAPEPTAWAQSKARALTWPAA